MSTLEERLALAESKMRQPRFRQNKGLGNEVGYYIFDYAPEDELAVRQWVSYIRRKYDDRPEGFRVLVFDLYDIMIDILQEKGFLEKCYGFERKDGFDRIVRACERTLRITSGDNLLVGYIREHKEPDSILLLTGVGKCYPILRSHTILNNLHQVIDDVPVVMLYPGKYSGQDLLLFGEIKDDNYYRAFKLVD